MKIDISYQIIPITYMCCHMDENFFNFILENKYLPSLAIQTIFKYYKKINSKRFKEIFVNIDTYQKYEALVFCGFKNNLITILTLTNKYNPNEERIIGKLLINEYMQKYYVRYKLDAEISYLERVRIQCERIDKLGKILKLFFHHRRGGLCKDILNKILRYLCKEDANYWFLYINPLPSKILRPYIEKDEKQYIDDIEYAFMESESDENSTDDND